MRIDSYIFLFLLLGLIGITERVQAQILQEDTVQAARRYPYIQFTQDRQGQLLENVDTGLQDFHLYNPAQSGGAFEHVWLGSTGQPHQSYVFDDDRRLGFHLGFRQFDRYRFHADSIRYFKTVFPYANMQYVLGIPEEQFIELTYQQPFSKYLNAQIHYRRIITPGLYARQRSSHHNFNGNIWLRTEDQRYQVMTYFLLNNAQVEQNGGIQLLRRVIPDENTGTRDTFFQRILIDVDPGIPKGSIRVELGGAESQLKQSQVAFQQSYDWGKYYALVAADSSETLRFVPKMRVGHQLAYTTDLYRYLDEAPSSTFYSQFYFDEDRTEDWIQSRKVSNELFLLLLGSDFNPYEDKMTMRYTARAGFRHDLIRIEHLAGFDTLTNVPAMAGDTLFNRIYDIHKRQSGVLFGRFANNPTVSPRLRYEVAAEYALWGFNWGDFDINGRLWYQLNEKLGGLEGYIAFRQLVPDYIMTRHFSNHHQWLHNDFKKTNTLSLKASYFNPFLNLRLSYHNYTLEDYMIWNELVEPEQLEEIVNVSQFVIQKNFKFWKLHLDNQAVLQTDNSRHLNLPTYWGKHSLYFYGHVFKNAMLAKLGGTIRYNSNFRPNDYHPAIGQFFLQTDQRLPYYPVVDLFLSFKVSRVRMFGVVTHANEGLFRQKGYYLAPDYPANDRAFKFGVSWMFYD